MLNALATSSHATTRPIATRRLVSVLVGVLAIEACDAPPASQEYVAAEAELAGFESWPHFATSDDAIPPTHEAGGSIVYINHLPPHGATEFPRGTIVLRVTPTSSPVPADWEAHAMVKRGGDYNATGARGWEFMDLILETEPDGSTLPYIRWRGESPPEGDGYEAPDGGVLLNCNHCHGASRANDSVLSAELDLTSF